MLLKVNLLSALMRMESWFSEIILSRSLVGSSSETWNEYIITLEPIDLLYFYKKDKYPWQSKDVLSEIFYFSRFGKCLF